MTITIWNNDKTKLEATYDPSHRQALFDYYNGLLNAGVIWQWTYTDQTQATTKGDKQMDELRNRWAMDELNNWDGETLTYIKTTVREWQAEAARREDKLIPKLRANDKLAIYKARELRGEWNAYHKILEILRELQNDNAEAIRQHENQN